MSEYMKIWFAQAVVQLTVSLSLLLLFFIGVLVYYAATSSRRHGKKQ